MAAPFRAVFLEAAMPLVKTVTVNPDGSTDCSPYPNAKRFTSHEHLVPDLKTFHQLILDHAAEGHCLYKGLLDRPLVDESRAGHTLTPEYTLWVCVDLDDYPAPTVAAAMAQLGLANVQHIVQHSARSSFTPGLRAHVFFLLTVPKAPTLLKAWLKHLNLSLGLPTELQASGIALKWPVDISTCQNDKILYIAPPLLNVPDPIADRIELVAPEGADEAFTLPPFPLDTEARTLAKINELRQTQDLPKRRSLRLVKKGAVEVLKNPEPAVVSDTKEERGFTYVNLNGGDSWGYFFPTGRPEVLYNFKDEPLYLLREIVPDFAMQLDAAPPAPPPEDDVPPLDTTGIQRWVISEKATGRYMKVAYDPRTRTVELMPAPDRRRLLDYTTTYNLPDPEVIPDWDILFDPTDTDPVDFQRRRINLFAPSQYWVQSRERNAPGDMATATPIFVLLRHVLGNDEVCVNAFVNWLAYNWQTGRKLQTAWILHGRTGTGKGLLFEVLRALYGRQAVTFSSELIADKFQDRLAQAQMLLVDEIDSDQMERLNLAPKLRSWITETTLPIRGMRVASVDKPSFFGVLLAANLRNAAIITPDDRRFNVPPRQEEPLTSVLDVSTAEFRRTLLAEPTLEAFAGVLASWDVDEDAVFTPLETKAKTQMMAVSTNSPDHLVQALLEGDFGYLVKLAPPVSDVTDVTPLLIGYREILTEIYTELVKAPFHTPVTVPLTRAALRTIFLYLLGWKSSPSKFEVSIARYGLEYRLEQVLYRGEVISAMPFHFVLTETSARLYAQMTGDKNPSHMHLINGGKS